VAVSVSVELAVGVRRGVENACRGVVARHDWAVPYLGVMQEGSGKRETGFGGDVDGVARYSSKYGRL